MGKSDNNSDAGRVSKELTGAGFLVRLAGTTLLVLATYNPSGWSFVHWLQEAFSTSTLGPEHFVLGVLVLIGWIILLTATQRSMGTLGLILGVALFGGIVWMLVDFGVLRIDSVSKFTWVVLIILSLMLAIGLSWSHVWRQTDRAVRYRRRRLTAWASCANDKQAEEDTGSLHRQRCPAAKCLQKGDTSIARQ